MRLRAAVILSVALVTAQAADAKTKRAPATKASVARTLPDEASAPEVTLRFLDAPRDSADRWMLQPIADEYDAIDPHGFRLRVRGAKMKMRVPLDLN